MEVPNKGLKNEKIAQKKTKSDQKSSVKNLPVGEREAQGKKATEVLWDGTLQGVPWVHFCLLWGVPIVFKGDQKHK